MIVFEFKIKAEENMKEYFLKTNRLGFSTWEKNDVKDAMELWGKGYAYEACIAVIEYAFEMLKFDGIFAGHNPKNQTSASLLKKLGFTYIKDEFYTPTGLFHPSYLMVKENYVTIKEMNKAEK